MKNIINVLAIAFLVFIFTFYVDGEMGVILIAFLLFAPLVSLFFAIYARKRVSIFFDCDGYVKKGSELEVTVTVSKEGRFPLAFVEVETYASSVFSVRKKILRFSLFSEDKLSYKMKIPAETGGNGEIGVTSVCSCGFLGFVKLKVPSRIPSPKSVGVIPEVPNVSASSALFRNIADIVMTSEDDEENDTAMMFSTNTTPGYEHREYVYGDSLKRINWKLSSKAAKLMVRLDEAASAVQPCILLDLYRESGADELLCIKREEKLLQSVFGLLELMIKQGIACTFVYSDMSGELLSENVNNPDYPSQILLKVLAEKVIPGKRLDPGGSTEGSCACIIATTGLSGDFGGILDKIHDKDNACVIVPEALDQKTAYNIPVWYLDEDNNFKSV